MKENNEYYFEVRDHQGILQIVFRERWAAEKFIELRNGWTITKVDNKGKEVD